MFMYPIVFNYVSNYFLYVRLVHYARISPILLDNQTALKRNLTLLNSLAILESTESALQWPASSFHL